MEYITPYYTNREQDALFVEDKTNGATGSINATCLGLVSPNGINSVSWGQRNLVSGASKNLSWEGGLGFFSTSPISKPSGLNLVNSITSLGLANYTAPTGSNFANSIFNSTGISFVPTTRSNVVSSVFATGLVTSYTAPSGTDLTGLCISAGLASVAYTAPSGTNLYSLANSTGFVSVSAPQDVGSAINNFLLGQFLPIAVHPVTGAMEYDNLYNGFVAMGFSPSYIARGLLPDDGNSVTPTNIVSIISPYLNIPTARATTIGVFHWSDTTFMTTTTLNFGLVPSMGSVTRQVSFGGTISSSVSPWWNPASFPTVTLQITGTEPSLATAISTYVPALSASLFTASGDVGGYAMLGLPWNIPTGLVFKLTDITTTGAILNCINATTGDLTQTTASYRILAF